MRLSRFLICAIGVIAVLAGPMVAAGAQIPARGPAAGTAASAFGPPVPTPFAVVVPFHPPPTPYSAGQRGVDLALAPGGAVLAAGAGTVAFAGSIAGRGVVVIVHAGGISTEYEPVVASVRAGQPVERGQPIGQLAGVHPGCASQTCLHWGARRAGVYFDPLSLLHPLGSVRLLPWS